ncbi:MAG: hypothetical protein HN948_00510 [Clostridia bacterium]|nr:hypothetical protein [Clostridia bacterium]MBT7121469.1 hypothetical protein [Clostridia bacterium]
MVILYHIARDIKTDDRRRERFFTTLGMTGGSEGALVGKQAGDTARPYVGE